MLWGTSRVTGGTVGGRLDDGGPSGNGLWGGASKRAGQPGSRCERWGDRRGGRPARGVLNWGCVSKGPRARDARALSHFAAELLSFPAPRPFASARARLYSTM